MTQLGKEAGMDAPFLQEANGAYLMAIDDERGLRLEEGMGIHFFCRLRPLPEKEERVLSEMMLANLMGQGTQGAVLGLSEDGQDIYLRDLKALSDYAQFMEAFRTFLQVIDFWVEEIDLILAGDATKAP
ncbi:MAG: sycE-A [Chlamydiales bacterium]|nr:sycE-A [Chlamydiales bacterium]